MSTPTAARSRRTDAPPAPADGSKAQQDRWISRLLGRQPIGMALAAPYAVFLAVVFAFPLGFAIYMAFHDYFFTAPGVTVPHPFVGLANFKTALTDPDVIASFGHVGIFLIINVPLTVVLSLLLAAALNQAIRGRTFFRVAYYVPYVTASVAVVGVWLFLFNSTGLVNKVLGPLAPSPSWLVNSFWAMPVIAIFVTWKQLGFFILLYLAALQNVPKELYESAATDGAGRWKSFTAVTLPGVRPATGLVVLLAIVTGANLFTEPYLLTSGGGPNKASTSPVLLMYQKGIEQGNPDVAAAIGVVLVIVVLIIALVSRRFTEGEQSMTIVNQVPVAANADPAPARRRNGTSGRVLTYVVLVVGALTFLFPFYYMVIGSLQKEPDTSVAGAFPNPGNLTGHNFVQINGSINLGRSLVNSGIFTGGVLLGTMVFGVLAGYALALLHFRGKGTLFGAMLLIQVVPFQLLMIPLYVLIARTYGLADNYLGMILPYAINSTAVFIFRQYFLQLPGELFDAARIDGANELRVLRSIALPLVRPALLTAVLLTFIGPWNEFLWPFLITKQQRLQPLAVSLANYISTVSATAANPFGAILAGAVVLAVPAVGLFIIFQRKFISTDLGSGVKGVTVSESDSHSNGLAAPPSTAGSATSVSSIPAPASPVGRVVPYTLTRAGTLMRPDPEKNADEAEGVLNPGSGWGPDGTLYLLPRLVAAGNVSRVGLAAVRITDGRPVGVDRQGVVLAPTAGWEHSPLHAGVEDPRITWIPDLRVFVMTYVAYGPLGPHPALATSVDLRSWRRLGPVHFEFQPDLDMDLNLVPNKDVVFFPEPVPGPDGEMCFAALHRPMWDLDWIVPGAGSHLPGWLTDDRPGIWISYVPAALVRGDVRELVHFRSHTLVAMPEYDFEELKIGAGPPPIRVDEGWLLIHHGVSGTIVPGVDQQQDARYAAGAMILSADDPSRVVARTPTPLLQPATDAETEGIVPNVVFPTAIELIDGRRYVFYGMADSQIGIATLDRVGQRS